MKVSFSIFAECICFEIIYVIKQLFLIALYYLERTVINLTTTNNISSNGNKMIILAY